MEITLNNKTGFINRSPISPIIIRDIRGIVFYDTSKLKKTVRTFNLPAGKYIIEKGNIKKLKKPVHYRLPLIKNSERNIKPPFDFKISFENNPNKCSIFWNEKKIIFDSSFLQAPMNQLFFILFHEYGHALYKSEDLADLCAVRLMLIRGYNPSQIGQAPLHSLSTQQYERKKLVIKKLLNR